MGTTIDFFKMLGFSLFVSSDRNSVSLVSSAWSRRSDVFRLERSGVHAVSVSGWCRVFDGGRRVGFGYGMEKIDPRELFEGTELPYGFAAFEISSDLETVRVIRDALGLQSVYYASVVGGLFISTDQNSLVSGFSALGIPVSYSPQALFETAAYKTAAPDRPMFSRISPLEFGNERTFSLRQWTWSASNPRSVFRLGFSNPEIPRGRNFDAEFLTAFSSAVEEIPDDGSAAVLFTGWLDSTLILDRALKSGKKNISAITVVQKDAWKTDDHFAVEYCRKRGVRHIVIETENRDYPEYFESVLEILEEPDSVLPGLSISLFLAARRARREGIRTLVSGSYVEPLLGSNPSTLMGLKYLYFGGRPPVERLLTSFERDWKEAGIDYLPFAKKRVPLENPWLFRKLSFALFDVFFSELGKFPLRPEEVFSSGFLASVDPSRTVFPNYFFTEGSSASVYDALTYSDLVFRGNIRNNVLNQRIANASEVSIVPIFAHAAVRGAFLSSPVEKRFDPKSYPTTYSDNKFFLFRAFWADMPPEIASRKKTEPSVPVFSEWLLSSENAGFVEAGLDYLSGISIFSDDYLDRLRRFYRIKSVRRDFEFPAEFKGKSSAFLNALWKAVAISVWHRRYFRGE